MPCYHPIIAYRSRSVNKNGNRPPVFNKNLGFCDQELKLPCGQCIGCRLERSRQWAIRCVHEASLHDDNCFITLTYDDKQSVPCTADGLLTLNKRDFVLFVKKMRRKYAPKKIRFFHCGEYGSQLERPHHHACLFGHNFAADRVLWSTRQNARLYRSVELETLWPYGYSTIGDCTWDSAAYVARYCTKKITGERAVDHYAGREPEYVTMSRRPGIGAAWFDRYKNDLYSDDACVIRDKLVVKPAKYYDKLYDNFNPIKMRRIKYHRAYGRPERDPDKMQRAEKLLLYKMWLKINRRYEDAAQTDCPT